MSLGMSKCAAGRHSRTEGIRQEIRDTRQMTYEVKRGSVAVCAFQATGKGFEAECTADGAERKPAEGGGVVLSDP